VNNVLADPGMVFISRHLSRILPKDSSQYSCVRYLDSRMDNWPGTAGENSNIICKEFDDWKGSKSSGDKYGSRMMGQKGAK